MAEDSEASERSIDLAAAASAEETNAEQLAALADEVGVETALDEHNWTALHHASFRGRGDAVRVLLKLGAPVAARDKYGSTPLYLAVDKGHESVVAALLEAGADVNAAAEDGWTPLFAAAFYGHQALVEYLLAAGADKSVKSVAVCDEHEAGSTAADVALAKGFESIHALLSC
eukprot:PLAT11418.1.p1 GENE.PLAT11418.1~~PLAT11418.1.p1  ORF type:complete len:185 (-),score=47.05 PLAT11418.1:360-878(-)